MPTITAAQIDRDINEAQALVKIADAIRDANLTPTQSIDVLARALAERTKHMSAHEEHQE